MKQQAENLTKAQQKIVEQLQGGVPLMRLPGGGYRFFNESLANSSAVRALIRKGLLAEAEDGLFPGCSQTVRIKEAA